MSNLFGEETRGIVIFNRLVESQCISTLNTSCEPCQDVPLSKLILIYYHRHGNNHEQLASANNLTRAFTLLSIGHNNFPRICTSEPAHWKAVS